MQNLNINSILKKSNYHRPLLFNSVLWSLAFIILLFIFSKGQIPITADYTYTLGFLLVIAVPVCINFYVLIPRFLRQERYIVYLLLFTTILISSAFIKSFLFGNLLDFIFPKIKLIFNENQTRFLELLRKEEVLESENKSL